VPRLILPLVLLAFVAGCSQPAQDAGPATVVPGTADPTAAPEEVAPVPAELPDVVARVNGEDISGAELNVAVARIEAQLGSPLPDSDRSHVVRELLDQLIAYRLLTQEAASRGLSATDAEIDSEVAFVQAQFPTAEAFAQALAQQQSTLEEFRTETGRQLAVGRLIDAAVSSQVEVTPEEVTAFYEANPDQFREGAQVRASHILIATEANDADAIDDARARAQDVLAQVEAGGDFAALAREYSDDPGSGPSGGDLGYFGQGAMVPEFEQAAFALQPGETSGLVQSQFGFHIIRVVDRQPERMMPLDDVRDQLQQYLQGQGEQEATQAFIARLRDEGDVEVLI